MFSKPVSYTCAYINHAEQVRRWNFGKRERGFKNAKRSSRIRELIVSKKKTTCKADFDKVKTGGCKTKKEDSNFFEVAQKYLDFFRQELTRKKFPKHCIHASDF